ncbi:hypothetical protein Pla52o_48510 [Novipirellula galeiformis]|uniref:Uncharacterized protein n=1 Tax=Novipirellula galeiformis TaxID=2528004 RepID=A0A5C6C2A1_9BACT|nr:hypothetical protein [Novipirellula galeiformis]TWU17636.1 hypothetical protein Pla52o_48510 [Novipirellula galeiformis]
MAKQQRDREDLLRDGHQMTSRGETTIDAIAVTVGFRAGGQASLYCGADPVFQFNAQHQLRRVYFANERFAAESGRLVRLDREQLGGKVQFVRCEVPPTDVQAILASLRGWIDILRAAASSDGTAWRVADEPSERFIVQLREWMDRLPQSIAIAAGPGA